MSNELKELLENFHKIEISHGDLDAPFQNDVALLRNLDMLNETIPIGLFSLLHYISVLTIRSEDFGIAFHSSSHYESLLNKEIFESDTKIPILKHYYMNKENKTDKDVDSLLKLIERNSKYPLCEPRELHTGFQNITIRCRQWVDIDDINNVFDESLNFYKLYGFDPVGVSTRIVCFMHYDFYKNIADNLGITIGEFIRRIVLVLYYQTNGESFE